MLYLDPHPNGGGEAKGAAYTHDFGFSGRVEVSDHSHNRRKMVHDRLPDLSASGVRVFFNDSRKTSLKEYTRQLRANKSWLSAITDAILRELPGAPGTGTPAAAGGGVPLAGGGAPSGGDASAEVMAVWELQKAEVARRAAPGGDPGEFGMGSGAPKPGPGCPKVFVYDLPANVAEFKSAGEVARAVGPNMDKLHKWLHHTSQYALSQLVLHRLLRPGAECRTSDPARADLFLVPALSKPKISSDWAKACARVDAKALVASLSHLSSETACRHLFIVPKGVYAAKKCAGWISWPVAPLHCASRVSYSYHVTAAQLALDSSHFNKGGNKDMYPYLHSVPYPASVHWPPKGGARELPPWKRQSQKDRPILMLFLGSATHGDKPVRELIQRMCANYTDGRVCTFKRFDSSTASLKAKARFCLEPGGDNPFRKSIADSLAMGCMPVTFSNITAEVAPWHWSGWRALGQLHVPRLDFLAGKIDLAALLRAQPSELAERSAAAIAANGQRWMFATDDSVDDDAFKVLLKGASEAAARQCAECDPEAAAPEAPRAARA